MGMAITRKVFRQRYTREQHHAGSAAARDNENMSRRLK